MPTPHQIDEAFAALRAGCDFATASDLSGIPVDEIVRLWKSREPTVINEFNPLAHEQAK